MMMKNWINVLVIGAMGCVAPTKPPASLPPPAPVAVTIVADQPLTDATLTIDTLSSQTGVVNGHVATFEIPPKNLGWGAQLVAHNGQQFDYNARITIPLSGQLNIAMHPTLPPIPSRNAVLNICLTFQGLMVQTALGNVPGFEAALPWLSPQDRQNYYLAKHAGGNAWCPNGDTTAMFLLPSGPPVYNEPNQPYAPLGPLDWTNGNTKLTPDVANLIHELLMNGFNSVLVFEGGDDGENGYPIAMSQLPLLRDALQNSVFGDLRPYVVVLPGFDGVFYGYTPEHVGNWLATCKSLFPYCGLEHSSGHIPVGNGPADYAPSGALNKLDLLLSEFGDDQYDDTIWQIAGRLLGPAYHRPSDQPANDDLNPPFYLSNGTVNCAFEFHEYSDVHSNGNPTAMANTVKQRNYLKVIGYGCGG